MGKGKKSHDFADKQDQSRTAIDDMIASMRDVAGGMGYDASAIYGVGSNTPAGGSLGGDPMFYNPPYQPNTPTFPIEKYHWDTGTNIQTDNCTHQYTSVNGRSGNGMFTSSCDKCGKTAFFKENLVTNEARITIGLILDLLIGGTDKEKEEALEQMGELSQIMQRQREGLELIESLYEMIQAKVADTLTP